MAAPLPVLRGTSTPLLQKQSFAYDLTRGGSYSEEWKGLVGDGMTALWNGTVYVCRSGKMQYEKDVATATFEWSADATGGSRGLNSRAVTQDRWECPEPKSERDVFTHPVFLAIWIATGVSYEQLINIVSTIRKYAEEAKSAGQSLTKENDMLNTISAYMATISLSMPSSIPLDQSMRFYRLYVNDQTHYQCSQYALRHTTTAPNGWSLNVSDLNTNCTYSTPQMLAEAENPLLWNFPLPVRLDYKLSAASAAFSAITPNRSNFEIGWLKSASAESSVGSQRIEIQTSYVLDQWSTDIYGSAA